MPRSTEGTTQEPLWGGGPPAKEKAHEGKQGGTPPGDESPWGKEGGQPWAADTEGGWSNPAEFLKKDPLRDVTSDSIAVGLRGDTSCLEVLERWGWTKDRQQSYLQAKKEEGDRKQAGGSLGTSTLLQSRNNGGQWRVRWKDDVSGVCFANVTDTPEACKKEEEAHRALADRVEDRVADELGECDFPIHILRTLPPTGMGREGMSDQLFDYCLRWAKVGGSKASTTA